MTVSDLTERALVARIQQQLPPPPPWMLVGIGDDGAVVEPERNRVDVFTVDALVEGVHFDRTFTPPEAIGHRALAVNLSDLAAMGAAPRLALLSLALPAALPLADFDGFVSGLTALARQAKMHIAGGNLTCTSGPLVIDITAVGSVKRRQALTRSGAQAGDALYVSGTIGTAAAGLDLLRELAARRSAGAPLIATLRAAMDEDTRAEQTTLTADDWRLASAYLLPSPRTRLGTLLARTRAASACMDLSDGLADAVRQVAEASGVGAVIEADALPIDPAARARFGKGGADVVAEALARGDDYELLVAVRPRTGRRLTAAIRHGGVPLTRIGVCTPEGGVVLRTRGVDTPLPHGYSHFGR